jgi:porin
MCLPSGLKHLSPAGRLFAAVVYILLLGICARDGVAASAAPPGLSFGETEIPAIFPPEGDDFWTRTNLFGDALGLRPSLSQYGLALNVIETSEVFGNITGGLKRGAIYEGVTDLNLGFDLRTYFHWRGVFFARAYQIHGRGLSANYLENLHTLSSIEATRTTRLYELWYEHHFGDWLRIRVGQQAAGQEFLITSTGRLFINSTFGWPTLPGADLPAGGSTYPLGTPGVRVRVDPSDELTFFAGAFNGNPVGPGSGDPQSRDLSGTAFRVNDGVFAIFETRYNPGNSPATGTYRIGAWYNSPPAPDPLSDSVLSRHRGNCSIYAIVDQPLFKSKDDNDDSGFAMFARLTTAPSDRNLIDFYVDGGLSYKGIGQRKDDKIGVAVGYARLGRAARQLDAEQAAANNQPRPSGGETVIELTYLMQLTPWWQIQPDFQYIVGIVTPDTPRRPLGDAAVFGLRTTITF